MYLAKFDAIGKPQSFLRPGVNVDTADVAAKIADGYIEISDEDHAYYVGNRGNGKNNTGYIRGDDGKPISAPARVVTKEEKVASISADYESQISELKDALTTATLSGDTSLTESLKTDYATTMAAYQTALKGVE